MKLSLRWIFDHLEASVDQFTIEHLVQRFNACTAEIEVVTPFTVALDEYAVGCISDASEDFLFVMCPEWEATYKIPVRTDGIKGGWYLIKKTASGAVWSTLVDWGSSKEGLMPQISCPEALQFGGWKKLVDAQDYVIEIDNKSITNRPDLWGHRGVAREFSALLGVPLISEATLYHDTKIEYADKLYNASKHLPLSVCNKVPDLCRRVAVCYVKEVTVMPSSIVMATRLARIDFKPQNIVVDITNYVMCDVGHPMHAFDARSFKDGVLEVSLGNAGTSLSLLDGSQITLTEKDLVISDGATPLSLAGIMGGKESSIKVDTKEMVVEVASFDPTTIRLSSAYHKVRTEGSARQEKTLDANLAPKALQRFYALMKLNNVPGSFSTSIVSLGKVIEPLTLSVEHSFISARLGIDLTVDFIKTTLEALGMKVVAREAKEVVYEITIDSIRSSKDIRLKEDIVEEIGRMYGYSAIQPKLPSFVTKAVNHTQFKLLKSLKEFLAYSAGMHEVENYSVFHNHFLKIIGYPLEGAVALKNALSEDTTHLVTSLIPHLLKNISEHSANYEDLRFFEVARSWKMEGIAPLEKRVVSGVFYHKKQLDFYECKEKLTQLFKLLDITVEWRKTTDRPLWASSYRTATLYRDGHCIGHAGFIKEALALTMTKGSYFAFEIDLLPLITHKRAEVIFTPLPKYQATEQDITVTVRDSVFVSEIEKAVYGVDERITQVALIGLFKKAEWNGIKSVTVRFKIQDKKEVLSKEVIEGLYKKVQEQLQPFGA